MRVFFSDTFDLDLPDGHRFPGRKYGMLRRKLLDEGVLALDELVEAPLATDLQLHRAHAPDYVSAIETGAIDAGAMRRIGFPWSKRIATRARATTGGAVAAAHAALEDGVSGQLAGGTHHAHYDYGAGYCIYNDFAVAALDLIASGAVKRVAVVDLDVHQGDGNAALLSPRDDVFVYSVHGQKNFPFRRPPSDLDIELPDGVGDDDYMRALSETLPEVFAFRPDIILYQAGVDPLREDKLGRMALTHAGLMARDQYVLSEARRRGAPVSIAIGGGYANPIEASVEAYANTWRIAKALHRI